jgi:hypothetical protein
MDKRERKDRNADESRYYHPDTAQNESEHGSSLMVWMGKNATGDKGS